MKCCQILIILVAILDVNLVVIFFHVYCAVEQIFACG